LTEDELKLLGYMDRAADREGLSGCDYKNPVIVPDFLETKVEPPIDEVVPNDDTPDDYEYESEYDGEEQRK
jgi:hypothetical protein